MPFIVDIVTCLTANPTLAILALLFVLGLLIALLVSLAGGGSSSGSGSSGRSYEGYTDTIYQVTGDARGRMDQSSSDYLRRVRDTTRR